MDQCWILCLTFVFLHGNLSCWQVVSYRGNQQPLPQPLGNVYLGTGAGAGAASAADCTWHPISSAVETLRKSDSTPLQLDCNVRKLSVDFWNYTFSPEQIRLTSALSIRCNPQLFFESFLNSSTQNVFQLSSLRSLQIDSCKIRKLSAGLWSRLGGLRNLSIHTHNGEWIGGNYGLELEYDAFQGAGSLERLDLSFNNIWSISDKLLCPLQGGLIHLNLSHNRLSEVWDDGASFKFGSVGATSLENSGSSSPNPISDCALSLQKLDLSHNIIRRIGRSTFSRMKALTTLYLDNNYIDEIEDNALAAITQLKTLRLNSNRLVALPPSLLKSCQLLEDVQLQNNSLAVLSPQVFAGLGRLAKIDLSRNALTSQWIKENIFNELNQLRILILSHNQLTYIDSNLLHGLVQLQSLHLDNNRVEAIDPQAFVTLTSLQMLDLSRNQLKFIEAKFFARATALRQLYLDYNRLQTIDDESFTNCTQLSDLGLAGNLLSKVPTAFGRQLPSLKTLDIGENKILSVNSGSFSGLGQLYGLRLAGNNLSLLPPQFCASLKSLRVLNLAQNQINTISSSAFHGCGELRALRLDSNELEQLPSFLSPTPQLLWLNVSENRIKTADYHQLPKTVEWLDLSYNALLSLGSTSAATSESSSFHDGNEPPLPLYPSPENEKEYHLRVLDASHNNLTRLDSTTVPPSLETLRVNHNRLTSVAPNTFSQAIRLRRVELMGNKLEELPMSALRLPSIFTSLERQLPDFYIGGGSVLDCSCSMEWLTRINTLSLLNRQLPRIVDQESVLCRPSYSRTNEVVPLIEAKPSHFLCPYKSVCFALCHCCGFNCDCENQCPDGCSCYHDASWTTNIVECSNLNMTSIPERIPMDATELYLDGNNLPTELNSHIFIGKKSLRVLHLNHSRIETIRNKTFNGLRAMEVLHLDHNVLTSLQGFEFDDLDNLQELHLHNNLLTYIAPSTFSRLRQLRTLRLDGNLLVDFNIWELHASANPQLNSVYMASNPWTCGCEFVVQVHAFVHARSASVAFVDYHLAKCQAQANNGYEDADEDEDEETNAQQLLEISRRKFHSQFSRVSASSATATSTSTAALSSICNTVENSNYAGAGTGPGPMLIHRHLSSDSDSDSDQFQAGTTNNAVRIVKDKSDAGSGSGSVQQLWTWLLIMLALVLLVATLLAIFRKEIYYWCLQHVLSERFPGCCCSPSARLGLGCGLREKVGCGSGGSATKLGGRSGEAGEDNEKLFDAYFLYSKHDEEMLCQKLTPELEQQQQNGGSGGEGYRLCLHYRDLCLNLENPWSSEMILTACDSSKRIVVIISRTFLHSELSNGDFRACLQHVLVKYPKKIIFILLPPLNEQHFPQIYPDFKSSAFRHTTLDWVDKNFWGKLKSLLPNAGERGGGGITNSLFHSQRRRQQQQNNMSHSHNNSPAHQHQSYELPYNISPPPFSQQQQSYESGSEYYRNIIPYQIPMTTSRLPQSQSRPDSQNNEPKLSMPLYWQQQQPPVPASSVNVIYPTQQSPVPVQYFSFADNFRHHRQQSQEQQQHQHPFMFASNTGGRSSTKSKDKRQSVKKCASNSSPYKPLIRSPTKSEDQQQQNTSPSVSDSSNGHQQHQHHHRDHNRDRSCSSNSSSSSASGLLSSDEILKQNNQLNISAAFGSPHHHHHQPHDEHIYSTLDSPSSMSYRQYAHVNSDPDGHDHGHSDRNQENGANNRTMYFV